MAKFITLREGWDKILISTENLICVEKYTKVGESFETVLEIGIIFHYLNDLDINIDYKKEYYIDKFTDQAKELDIDDISSYINDKISLIVNLDFDNIIIQLTKE